MIQIYPNRCLAGVLIAALLPVIAATNVIAQSPVVQTEQVTVHLKFGDEFGDAAAASRITMQPGSSSDTNTCSFIAPASMSSISSGLSDAKIPTHRDASLEVPGNDPARSYDQASSSDEEESRLEDLLPKANLYGGISPDSFQRTLLKREIADPNQSFLASAQFAPDYFRDDGCVFWKTWTSPNMKYRQLYFEEPNVERYGIYRGRLQPVVSGAHFITNVVVLPYKVGARRPNKLDYSLGYYRPGNCNPAYGPSMDVSVRGGIVQALTIGLIVAGLGL